MARSFLISPSVSAAPTCALPDQLGSTRVYEGRSRTMHRDTARWCHDWSDMQHDWTTAAFKRLVAWRAHCTVKDMRAVAKSNSFISRALGISPPPNLFVELSLQRIHVAAYHSAWWKCIWGYTERLLRTAGKGSLSLCLPQHVATRVCSHTAHIMRVASA